jgi:hypothetical protein
VSTYTVGQVLWSLVDMPRTMGGIDMEGEWVSAGYIRVDMRWVVWTVERVTPKGAWVRAGREGDTLRGNAMWVANNTRKVAATRQEAKDFALVKRAYHARMCAERLEHAQTRLAALQALRVEE